MAEARPEPAREPAAPAPAPSTTAAKAAPAAGQVAEAAEDGPARNEARAAGAGGGAEAGAASSPDAAGADPDAARRLVLEWGAKIRSQVQQRRELDRGDGRGEALVMLVVSPNGDLLSHAIRRSAGARLDRAAMRAVAAAAPFPSAPAELGGERRSFLLPVRFN